MKFNKTDQKSEFSKKNKNTQTKITENDDRSRGQCH